MTSKANPQLTGNRKELDSRVKRVDEDRWLASRYAGADSRWRLTVLSAFHYELVRALHMSEPMLGRIRIQWWREAVEEIHGDGPARSHEVVDVLGPVLSGQPEARSDVDALLEAFDARIDDGETSALIRAGGLMSRIAGRLLDDRPDTETLDRLQACGEAHAAAQMGDASAEVLFGEAQDAFTGLAPALAPAAAHVALAPVMIRQGQVSGFGKRWRIFRAIASGKIGR